MSIFSTKILKKHERSKKRPRQTLQCDVYVNVNLFFNSTVEFFP